MQTERTLFSPYSEPPRDILLLLGDQLPAEDLARASAVNRCWHRTLSCHPRWRQHVRDLMIAEQPEGRVAGDFWRKRYVQGITALQDLETTEWTVTTQRPMLLRRPFVQTVIVWQGLPVLLLRDIGAVIYNPEKLEDAAGLHEGFHWLPNIEPISQITAVSVRDGQLCAGTRDGKILGYPEGEPIELAKVPGRVIEVCRYRSWFYVLYMDAPKKTWRLRAVENDREVWDVALPGRRHKFIRQFEVNDELGVLLSGHQLCLWKPGSHEPPEIRGLPHEVDQLWTQFCLVGDKVFFATGKGEIACIHDGQESVWHSYEEGTLITDMVAGPNDFSVFTRHRNRLEYGLDHYSASRAQQLQHQDLDLTSPASGTIRVGRKLISVDGEGRLLWIDREKGLLRASQQRNLNAGHQMIGCHSTTLAICDERIYAATAQARGLAILSPDEASKT